MIETLKVDIGVTSLGFLMSDILKDRIPPEKLLEFKPLVISKLWPLLDDK